MIHLICACGASLEVSELYAGGQVLCQTCGAPVLVPADHMAEDRFRFHCPHCETRVVARKSSAGKKSQCPVCEKVYIVPEPPPEFDSLPSKDPRRIEIGTDELALKIGLPFPVGKLEPVTSRPPEARYLHNPSVDGETAHHLDSLPAHVLPTPEDNRRANEPPPIEDLLARPFYAPGGIHHETAPTAEWSRTPQPAAAREPEPSSTAPTAAAIPQMTAAAKPASVGELQVMTGSCSGQRIRLNFHRFMVGAERDCNLRPQSPLLSRHHCVFKKDEYSLRVRDLGSTDGTFVNGRRIFTEAILKPGDEVRIADVTFYVSLPRAPEIIQLKADSMPSISDFVIL
jgi:pSer/pThr/pTyr-binding forkhead associated (FHA) protein